MARSNKPILWLPFAAGGLVSALAIPALIVITGVLLPLGLIHLPFEKLVGLLLMPMAKLMVAGVIALSVWHAAHRLRMTAHDLGLGSGIFVEAVCYGAAMIVIVATIAALLTI
ncbi:MAG: fumarate reductase subunit FrdD [Rhodomicrobium sp.]